MRLAPSRRSPSSARRAQAWFTRALAVSLSLLAFFAGRLHASPAVEATTASYASLSPHLTEIVFAVGAGGEVAAVTDFCRHPLEARSVESVGSLMALQVERLIAMRPGKVFYSAMQTGDQARLRAANTPLIFLPTETIDDITSAVRIVGREVGRDEQGNALAERIGRQLAALGERANAALATAGGKRPQVLLVLSRRPGAEVRQVLTAGPGTFLHELIELAGGDNVAKGVAMKYPTLGTESLLSSRRPDVVIELRQGDGDGDGPASSNATGADGDAEFRAAWTRLYGKSNPPRLVRLDTGALLIPGPRVVQSAGILLDAIWKDAPAAVTPGVAGRDPRP